MQAFEGQAKYYDLFASKPGRLDREGPFLAEHLARAPGPRVLDAACGTGIHAHFLAGLGASVTAFDISFEMALFAAERRAHPGIRYAVGDMRTIAGGPWDMALCLGNSLGLLSGPHDIDQTFSAVFGALAPGGLFLVQVLNGSLISTLGARQRVERANLAGQEVVAVKDLVPQGGRTLLALTYFVERCAGEWETFSQTAVLRHLSLGDVHEPGLRAGFRPEGEFGALSGEAYQPDTSTDLVCVFRKPTA